MDFKSTFSVKSEILSWCKLSFKKTDLIGEDNFVSIIDRSDVKSFLYHPAMETVQSLIKNDDDVSKKGLFCVSDLYQVGLFDGDCIFLPQFRENKDLRNTWYKYQITNASTTKREDGITPLTLACYFGKPQLVMLLLSVLDHPVDVSTVDGSSPIIETIAGVQNDVEDRLQCLQHLVKHGASHESEKKTGHNALTISCFRGKEDFLKLLDASFSILLDWNHQTSLGHTPLMFAVYSGNLEVMQYLINTKNVDIMKENCNFLTAFDLSLLLDSTEAIKGFLAIHMHYNNMLKGYIQRRIEMLYHSDKKELSSLQVETLFVALLLSVAYLGRFKQVRNVILETGVLDFIINYVSWENISPLIKTEFSVILAVFLFYDGDSKGMSKLIATNWATTQFEIEKNSLDQLDEYAVDRFMAIVSLFLSAEDGVKWALDKFMENPELGMVIADFELTNETFDFGLVKEIIKIISEFNIEEGFEYHTKHDKSRAKKYLDNTKSLKKRVTALIPARNSLVAQLNEQKKELQVQIQKKKKLGRRKKKICKKEVEISFISKQETDDGKQQLRNHQKGQKNISKQKCDVKDYIEANITNECSKVSFPEHNGHLSKKEIRKLKKENKKRHLQHLQINKSDEYLNNCNEDNNVVEKPVIVTSSSNTADVKSVNQNTRETKAQSTKLINQNARETVLDKKDKVQVTNKSGKSQFNVDFNKKASSQNASTVHLERVKNTVVVKQVICNGETTTVFKKTKEMGHTEKDKKPNNMARYKAKESLKERDKERDNKIVVSYKVKESGDSDSNKQETKEIDDKIVASYIVKESSNLDNNKQEIKGKDTPERVWDIDSIWDMQNKKNEIRSPLQKSDTSKANVAMVINDTVLNQSTSALCIDNKSEYLKQEMNQQSFSMNKNRKYVKSEMKKQTFRINNNSEYLKEQTEEPSSSTNKTSVLLTEDKKEQSSNINKNGGHIEMIDTNVTERKGHNKEESSKDTTLASTPLAHIPAVTMNTQSNPLQWWTFNNTLNNGFQQHMQIPFQSSLEGPKNQNVNDEVERKYEAYESTKFPNRLPDQFALNECNTTDSYQNTLLTDDTHSSSILSNYDPAIICIAKPVSQVKEMNCTDLGQDNDGSSPNKNFPVHFPSFAHEPLSLLIRSYFPNNECKSPEEIQINNMSQQKVSPVAAPNSANTTKASLSTDPESGYLSPTQLYEERTEKPAIQPMFVKNWQKKSIRWNPLLTRLAQSSSQNVTKIGSINFLNDDDAFISKGSCGTVVRVGIRDDGSEVAVKCMVKVYTGLIANELRNLRELQHANIIHYKDYVEDANFAYVALELCEYTLEEYIVILQKSNSLQHHIRRLSRQLITGLKALHDAKVLHMDLKPRNVLVDVKGNIRLADFGLSHRLNEEQNTFYHTSAHGTKCWRAPETICTPSGSGQNTGRYKPSTDIYVSAMILYFIVTGGRHPFGEDTARCEMNILKGELPNIGIIHDEVFLDLFLQMMDPDMNRRLSVEECLAHPFFWEDHRRFQFLVSVGHDHEVAARISNALVKTIESMNHMRKANTGKKLCNMDKRLLQYMGWEKLQLNSVLDILTGIIPDVDERYDQLSEYLQRITDKDPDSYLISSFPGLFMVVYEAVCKVGWKRRHGLREYFYTGHSV